MYATTIIATWNIKLLGMKNKIFAKPEKTVAEIVGRYPV
jgi:hypothetical protein